MAVALVQGECSLYVILAAENAQHQQIRVGALAFSALYAEQKATFCLNIGRYAIQQARSDFNILFNLLGHLALSR